MRFFFLLTFFLCMRHCWGGEGNPPTLLPQQFVVKLLSERTSENQKKAILENFRASGLALNDDQIKQILMSVPNIRDEELLEQTLDFLASEPATFSFDDIKQSLTKLIDAHLSNNLTLLCRIFKYFQLLCNEPLEVAKLEYGCLKQSDPFLELMLKSYPDDVDRLIDDITDHGLYSLEFFDWLCGKVIPDDNIGLRLSVLKYLHDHNYAHNGLAFLRDVHLQPLAQMTMSPDKKLQLLPSSILSIICHRRGSTDWIKFIEENKLPVIEIIAFEVICDKAVERQSRIFASDQLNNIVKHDANLFDKISSKFLEIISDEKEDIYLRAKCYLHGLNLYLDNPTDTAYGENFIQAIVKLTENARLHERVFSSINSKIVNNPVVWNRLVNIFENTNLTPESRAFALFALRLSDSRKKHIAQRGIDFLKEISTTNKARAISLSLCAIRTLSNSQESDFAGISRAVSGMPDDPLDEK